MALLAVLVLLRQPLRHLLRNQLELASYGHEPIQSIIPPTQGIGTQPAVLSSYLLIFSIKVVR